MRVFDASSMIYAWDNYPEHQFPPLWKWIAGQIEQNRLVMPRVAFEEVANKTPDCGAWLKDNDLEQLEISNTILQDAMWIKGLLGIVGDNYHAKGVGENDLFIIATARAHKAELRGIAMSTTAGLKTRSLQPSGPSCLPRVTKVHELASAKEDSMR